MVGGNVFNYCLDNKEQKMGDKNFCLDDGINITEKIWCFRPDNFRNMAGIVRVDMFI